MDYRIKIPDLDDIVDIESIVERTLPGYDIFPSYEVELKNILKTENPLLYTASNGYESVGFIHGYDGFTHGHIEYLAVDPDYQGEGIGKALMKHIAKEFKERDFKEIFLTAANNSSSFYERLGFEEKHGRMYISLDRLL